MNSLDDVNSKTTLEDFITLKKADLITFLRKLNAKISGNKPELALRCFDLNQLQHGIAKNIDNVDKTSRDFYAHDKNIPPITELNSGWTSNEDLLPKLSHKDVEEYLCDSSHRTEDRDKMQCYRQFIRGYNFYKEKYIHDIMVNTIDDGSEFCYVRSKCFPSMKQGKYIQWLLLTKEKPFHISQASCTCPAGLV